jgi:magnesium-transporting ATPase (P-type)
MRDANSEYPVRPAQKRAQNPFDNDADTLPESTPRRGPMHQRQTPTSPTLPAGGVRKMLSISLVASIIVAIVNIVFTLVNAPLYHQAASYSNHPNQMPLNVASSIFWIFVLTSIISLIIYFIAGFIIGRVVVARRLGFFGGFLASAIALIIGYIIEQIPNYPGTINTGFSSNPLKAGGGLIAALIFLMLAGLVGGLLGWLGARLATRRHPFYVGMDV